MAIIKQGILGGFKKKIGSVVGSSWKGLATMRSLPLSVANPRTAAQVSNRDRFKACAEFASLILASVIKPLMDRFAGQMSGYNLFTKLNKEVFANPASPVWADLLISKGKMIAPTSSLVAFGAENIEVTIVEEAGDRYALPTDKLYVLLYNSTTNTILFQGDTGKTRADGSWGYTFDEEQESGNHLVIYLAFLHADGSEVSNTAFSQCTVS